MAKDVSIVGSNMECKDLYVYQIIDDGLQKHTVHIQASLLNIEPTRFLRGSDQEHLDRLACGTVMMSVDPHVRFHRVDPEMVDRAYEAALRVKSFYQLD
jgi:hypothetical protein